MAAIAAQPIFRLLGAKVLGRSDDYTIERMPSVNVEMLDGPLAWRQHDGGHTDEPNVVHFIDWANRLYERTKADLEFPSTVDPRAQVEQQPAPLNRHATPGAANIPEAVHIKRPTTAEMQIAEKA